MLYNGTSQPLSFNVMFSHGAAQSVCLYERVHVFQIPYHTYYYYKNAKNSWYGTNYEDEGTYFYSVLMSEVCRLSRTHISLLDENVPQGVLQQVLESITFMFGDEA